MEQTTENASTAMPDMMTDLPAGDHLAQTWTPDRVMTAIYLALGTVGFLGNTFVIAVIFTHTAMKKQMTNLLIINQSLVDAFASVVMVLNALLADRGRELHGVSGALLCRFWYSMFFLWSPMVSSTVNLLAITLERYVCIVHPVTYKNRGTRAAVLCACAGAWAFGFLLEVIISILPAGLDENHRCNVHWFWPSRKLQQGVGVTTIIMVCFIPLGVMSYCYTRIAMVLKARIAPSNGEVAVVPVTAKDNKLERARQNVIRTLIIVSVCFSICWTPNQCIFLYFNLGYSITFTTWYYHLSIILVYCNCCCNPFIYIAQYEQFQKGVKNLKRKMLRKAGSLSLSDTTHMSNLSATA